jgi:uncharacterized protein YoxC
MYSPQPPHDSQHHIPKQIMGIKVENWAAVAVAAISFIYGYSQLSSKVDNISDTMKTMHQRDENIQAQVNVLRDLSATRQVDIAAKMSRVEAIMERIEGKTDRFISISPKGVQ